LHTHGVGVSWGNTTVAGILVYRGSGVAVGSSRAVGGSGTVGTGAVQFDGVNDYVATGADLPPKLGGTATPQSFFNQ